MNLYAIDQPAASGIYAPDPRVPGTPGSIELGGTLEAGTIESAAPTLGGDFYRVIVDQGDFEYLTAQAASVAGDLTIDHTPVEITGSGTVVSLSASLTGTFTITGSTSGWINVVAGGGSWSYVTPAGGTWTDV